MTEALSKGEQARAEILAAAKTLFIKRGYSATSMRDIAHHAGKRAVAGIYNHFPNKQTIFRVLMEEMNPFHKILAIIENAQGITAPEFMRQVLPQVIKTMLANYDFFELVQIDGREFQGEHVKSFLQIAMFPRMVMAMQRLLNLPGLKVRELLVLMRLFASTVIGFVITQRIAPSMLINQQTVDEWIEHYTEMLLYGLATPDQSTE